MKYIAITMMSAAICAGCAAHSRAPIKEIAYDFTDYGYYDRQFGVSPRYEPTQTGRSEAAESATNSEMVAFPCNKQIDGDDEEITCYFHHRKGKGASSSDVVLESGNPPPEPPPASRGEPGPASPAAGFAPSAIGAPAGSAR